MKHGQKMVLVNYNEPQPQQQQQINEEISVNAPNINPNENLTLSFLDQDMKQILNRTDINDIEKWRLYSQTLSRYLFYVKKQQQDKIDEINSLNNAIAELKPKTITKVNINRKISKPFMKSIANIARSKRKSKTIISDSQIIATPKGNDDFQSIEISSDNDSSGDVQIISAQKEKRISTRQLRNRKVPRNTPASGKKQKSKTRDSIFKHWQKLIKFESDYESA